MNAMRYQSEILYNVRSVLCRVRDRGGKFSKSFVMQEYARFQGERAAIVLNVALKAGAASLLPIQTMGSWILKEIVSLSERKARIKMFSLKSSD